jgi:hypothetical protein
MIDASVREAVVHPAANPRNRMKPDQSRTHFITPPAKGVHQPVRTPAAARVSLVHWLQVLPRW